MKVSDLRRYYKQYKITQQKFYVREGRPELQPEAEQAEFLRKIKE